MALILPRGPDFSSCTHNLDTSNVDNPSNGLGVKCTPGTENSDGSAVDLFGSALPHDGCYVRLMVNYIAISTGNNDILMDLLIDPAGGTSWSELIDSLIVGGCAANFSAATPAGPSVHYDFPIWLPAGATLGVRARTAHTSTNTLKIACFVYGDPSNPEMWWCGQRVTSIGINASSSTGTAHTAGDSNAFSSWADLGSPLPQAAHAFQWGINGVGSGSYNTRRYNFEFGVGDVRIGPPMHKATTPSETGVTVPVGLIFKSAPTGSQIRVRGQCSATAQSLGVAAYAVH